MHKTTSCRTDLIEKSLQSVFNFSKQKGLFLFFFFLFATNNSFALTGTIDNNFNFGTFTQTSQQASFVLSYDSIMSSVSGLTVSGTPTAARITITSVPNGDKVTTQDSHESSIELDGCTMTFSNIIPSIDNFVLNPGHGKTRTISYGITVNIDGFCAKGTYDVSAVLIDIHSSKSEDFSTYMPITVTFNEYIDVIQVKEMNFGSFFSPQTSGTVVVHPNSSFEATNINIYDQGIISAGKFTIGGLENRDVQLSFSNAVLSNGTETMTVDNLNADVGTSFTINSDNFSFNVGGTLHVAPKQASGHYVGTYNIILSY